MCGRGGIFVRYRMFSVCATSFRQKIKPAPSKHFSSERAVLSREKASVFAVPAAGVAVPCERGCVRLSTTGTATPKRKKGAAPERQLRKKCEYHIPVRPERSTPSTKYFCRKVYMTSSGSIDSRQPDSSHTIICLTLTDWLLNS